MTNTLPSPPAPSMARPASRRRRRWTGLVLLAAGVVVLGYVGHQMFVTNWISERRHAAIINDMHDAWDRGSDEASASDGSAGAILRIPRFGDDFAVPILDGVSDDILASGVGRFEESAKVGGLGNYALVAHRVTHGEPFRRLPELRPGDHVIIETRTHLYTYVLDTAGDALTVGFKDGWVLAPRPVNPDPDGIGPTDGEDRLLTLTTCAELFHTDQRLVAFGHLLANTPKAEE